MTSLRNRHPKQGGDALHAADPAEDVGDALDGDQKAAAAAVTAEELNTSCLPGGIARLMNADSDLPAPAADGAGIAGAAGAYGKRLASRAVRQRFSVNGIAAAAPSAADGASPAPTIAGATELLPRWMQPDPVHSALHAGDTSTPHAAANGTGAVSAMGQWDSSYSLNTINQQPPCTSASQPYGATCGVPVFPADARAHRGQTATGLKRGFHESGCGGVETASGPARQRMRCNSSNNPLAGAELVGAASSSNTGSAASAAWMRRADRELDELMRDMGMLVEQDGCGMAGAAGVASTMRGLAPLQLPDPRPHRDLSSLLLHGPVTSGQCRFEQLQQQRQKPLAAPQQAPVNWQLLQQVQPQLAMRCATGGWPLQRGASVGGYEIEAIDSVPLEALL